MTSSLLPPADRVLADLQGLDPLDGGRGVGGALVGIGDHAQQGLDHPEVLLGQNDRQRRGRFLPIETGSPGR